MPYRRSSRDDNGVGVEGVLGVCPIVAGYVGRVYAGDVEQRDAPRAGRVVLDACPERSPARAVQLQCPSLRQWSVQSGPAHSAAACKTTTVATLGP